MHLLFKKEKEKEKKERKKIVRNRKLNINQGGNPCIAEPKREELL